MLILTADNLKTPAVAHGFFGRTGGVSEGLYAALNCGPGSGDARAHVIENRRRVGEALGAAAPVTLGQTHSATAVTVTAPWRIGEVPADDAKTIPPGDAMVTAVPGIALGILTADCAPILFADAEARVIGAAHAGWKGALTGVVEATLAAMAALGAQRARIAAAIGPCISQQNYEVGPEFRDRFVGADAGNARYFIAGARTGHDRFDLPAYVAARLRDAGVDRIERIAGCTYARDADFFSFRRATHRGETAYGREISAIVLR
ncbi:MAG TPA: peptidoglycan editing factor PgeF [Rhizomicrobium sp.]|jgi:YfiH family protein|nr:peptidoglycan editing factor PgeF [Rhizomicrobium sp.]